MAADAPKESPASHSPFWNTVVYWGHSDLQYVRGGRVRAHRIIETRQGSGHTLRRMEPVVPAVPLINSL